MACRAGHNIPYTTIGPGDPGGETRLEESILVTGAAGFIGAALCRRLLAEGRFGRVVGLDNVNEYYDAALKEHRLCALRESERFAFVRGSVTDRALLARVFDEYRPAVVVHLAAQAGVRWSIDHPDEYIRTNVLGFYEILEACRHAGDVEHLVFASSSSVYGDRPDGDTDHPVSLYAATKKSDEVLAHAYAGLYGIPTTGLRFFTVYGPAGRPDMFYYSAAEKLRRGETLRVFAYGRSTRDYTYVDDTVEAIRRVIDRPPAGRTPFALYDVGAGKPTDMNTFLTTLADEMIAQGLLPEDFSLPAHCEYLPGQPGDVTSTCADSAPLSRDFGFVPTVPLREGLREFLRWFRQYEQVRNTARTGDPAGGDET